MRKTLKTGVDVIVPLLVPLRKFLETLPQDGEYVLPVHARMYENSPDGISRRFKKLLDKVGIEQRRKVKGRSRQVTVHDIHSLRHTFVWRAATMGVPLSVVQSVVGHLNPAMTAHYENHATLEDKRRQLGAVPDYKAEIEDGVIDVEAEVVDPRDVKLAEIEKILAGGGKSAAMVKQIRKVIAGA